MQHHFNQKAVKENSFLLRFNFTKIIQAEIFSINQNQRILSLSSMKKQKQNTNLNSNNNEMVYSHSYIPYQQTKPIVFQVQNYAQQCGSNKSLASLSHLQNQQEDTIQIQSLVCNEHQRKIGNFFCKACCSFNICGKCIVQSHVGEGHQIVNFFQVEQGIQTVKQYLFETIEQTLKKMKSRQNEMKNGVSEINLIQKGIRRFKQELLVSVRQTFELMQKIIEEQFQLKAAEEVTLLSQFQKFNQRDSKLTQEIRVVLTDIVDSKIDILSFSRDMVVKSPPELPNFPRIKNYFEKQRKLFKEIKSQIQQMSHRILQKLGKKKRDECSLKYEKFIFGKKANNLEPKQSFIKTLRIMDKQNISINLLKSRNKSLNKKIHGC